MKGKSKYLVLIILFLIMCSGIVTYALFRTNKSGNANVNAARWNVVFKNGEEVISDNFNIQLSNATWTNPLGNVASGKIAPGSSATFYITIDASNTETDVDYTVEIEDTFNETDFDVTLADDGGTIAYSTESNAMIRQIPIQVIWNGNINDNDNKNESDLLKRARNIIIPIKLTAAQKLALKYTITFEDGFGNTLLTKKVSMGENIGSLPENPSKIGYTFAGWYDNLINGTQVTTETIATQGMNVYAHWNIKNVTVTFNSNGGSSVEQQIVQEGSTLSSVPTSTKSNNELIGWYNSSNENLTTSTPIMNDVTYNAFWRISNYSYSSTDTNKIKEFSVPVTGTYKLEVWGAQGGSYNSTYKGGYGGYSTGEIELVAGEKYYVVVGSQGASGSATIGTNYGGGGYNGGGSRSGYNCSSCIYVSSGGGGATHIASQSALLSALSSETDRQKILIVAGGGGGNGYTDSGWNVNSTNIASGGGKTGNKGNLDNVHNSASLATQDSGAAFGQGQNCGSSGVCDGGGGGYFGGYTGTNGASGGSGYLKSTLTNKSMYCYNCQEDDNVNTYTISTYGTTTHASERDTTNCPNGYSSNPVSKCAKAGDGYAKITFINN